MKWLLSIALLSWFGLSGSHGIVYADEITITTAQETEIPIQVFPADGDRLVMLLPSEHGYFPGHTQLANGIADQGTEVWMLDLFAAYYAPVSTGGMKSFSPADIVYVAEQAHRQTGKEIYLLTNDKGTETLLRSIRHWQQQKPVQFMMSGAVIISPYLFVSTPSAGTEVAYLPIAASTNFNLFLLQPELSPRFWRFSTLIQKLEQGGSDLYIQRLEDARDRFFFRPDAAAEEKQLATRLPSMINRALRMVKTASRERQAVVQQDRPVNTSQGGARGLQPYKGDLQAADFSLQSLAGKNYSLEKLSGKVVLVNFWATWCPPCVHEMPSMQALKDKFEGRPFEIVAINMAEDRSTIEKFLQRMQVDFTILLDTDGSVLQQWKVFAFPTSYILDGRGDIQLGGYGAIDWEEAAVVKQIEQMLLCEEAACR